MGGERETEVDDHEYEEEEGGKDENAVPNALFGTYLHERMNERSFFFLLS